MSFALRGGVLAVAILGIAAGPSAARAGVCSDTARLQFAACKAEVKDDDLAARAICLNTADDEEREECLDEAAEARVEETAVCKEQKAARLDLCGALGEGPYDPDFDPADFEDPRSPAVLNSHLPLAVGNTWTHEGGGETVIVEVLDETKYIEGVDCLVVRDRVFEDGALVEDTDDWFALATNGDVWYCGEEVKDFEFFDGDDPELPELVSIDGSFKAGRDGDKAGTLIRATPQVGDTYRQEWSAGNAEDAAQVLSTTYGYGNAPTLDEFVPQALAELLCDDDCWVTGEFTPIEPDAFERKYYAPGIGRFLEVDAESGDTVQLVDCNFDARCAALPTP
ncbi:MAG: hypothetical protein ABFS41_00440 [Myxococcota bacterium]